MRVALLTSTGPKYDYLAAVLAERFALSVVVRQTLPQSRVQNSVAYQFVRRAGNVRLDRRRRFFAIEGTVDVTRTVAGINSPEVLYLIERSAPDVTVVCGTSIIRDPLLDALPCAINLHAGYLPWYRGNHGIFFAYRDRAWSRIGSTVHLLDRRVDGGAVIARVRPAMTPIDGVEQLYCAACRAGIEILIETLTSLQAAASPVWAAPQDGSGRTYRHRDRRFRTDLEVALSRVHRLSRPPRAARVVEWMSDGPDRIDVRSLVGGGRVRRAHGPW